MNNTFVKGLPLILSIFFITSCTLSREVPNNKRSVANVKSDKLTCDEFFPMLAKNRPDSIDKTLAMVKKERPLYLGRATFAYNSKSLHESSFNNPRAVVFGSDAKMILSFNGNKS